MEQTPTIGPASGPRSERLLQRKASIPGALDVVLAIGLALFWVGLPFHLVVKRLVPGPAGTYWKEGLLGVLILLWAAQQIAMRAPGRARARSGVRAGASILSSGTSLDWAVFGYLLLPLLRLALDRSGWVGAWGLYASVLYLPLFWLVATTLRARPSWAIWLAMLLAGIGGLVALGGLAEFLFDRSLWPSDEIVQRLGHPDFYVYGTHVRRVYFTFDSPTTLANTLALLLPLALALAAAPDPLLSAQGPRRRKGLCEGATRAALIAAAATMAACILVTFSRGIWVATALSLLAVGLLSGAVRTLMGRHWKHVLAVGGLLALLALVLALAAGRPASTGSTGDRSIAHRNAIELSSAAYAAAPLQVTQKLLDVEPIHGERVLQTWTLPDPIARRQPEGDTRPVLYEHPPESGKQEIIYRVQVPDTDAVSVPALRFAIAVAPQVWSPEHGDGTSFQIHVGGTGAAEDGQFVFIRYINPKHNPSDRRWRNYLLDLSPWAGQTVHLSLITESGPAGDWAFDWGGWADLEIGHADRTILDAPMTWRRTPPALVRHASSILDWARDETNRDRLAAWSLAWDAWRSAPLWGRGLGTTGTAALRTQPERAFVTESQVLKALVELGLPGLLAWGYLWFQIARAGHRAYRNTAGGTPGERTRHLLLLGVLAGLLIVFIEGWVYQNLEVKQVNAYFWTLTGLLAFLARRQGPDA